MNAQQKADNYLAAASVLPLFLAKNFKGLVPDVAVLGYGKAICEAELALWRRDNHFSRVFFYDVQNENDEELGILRVVSSPLRIPKGTFAVAVHPGIEMTDMEAMDLWGTGNRWDETLDAFRPLFLAFCDYSEEEHAEALAKLDEIGYVKVHPIDTSFFRESYAWSDKAGPGWSASIMSDVKDPSPMAALAMLRAYDMWIA